MYRWGLAVERNNPQLHARLGPLLARIGEDFDGWLSSRRCAETAIREQREERALALYRDATRTLPREVQAWQSLAHLLVKRGAQEEALAALREGSEHFRTRKLRSQAIHLLRRSRVIDAWDAQCVLELARVLALSGQRKEALILLAGLAGRCEGAELRRIRATQVRIDGSLGALWRWLRCCLRPDSERAPHRRTGRMHAALNDGCPGNASAAGASVRTGREARVRPVLFRR